MVHSLSEIWSAAATPPLWLSSQLTVGKEHPLVRPAQPKAKAPPLAAHSKWHRPISKMTHYHKSWWMTCIGLVAVVAFPRAAAAHRLDECLQATRISIAPDAILLEID